MADNLRWLFLVSLCCGLAVRGDFGVTNPPFSANSERDIAAMAPAPSGTCKSMVEIHGYVCEEHTVTTQDGYILSMQRIPEGRTSTTKNKLPVLLQHGLFMDGITWLLNSPDQSLAFILADNGFDVWIANTRGTTWSCGHTHLSSNDSAYWAWSWDELVSDELPATFQYVYDQTGQKLNYVGHSLGTLIALASFSQMKLLNMLTAAALLSPIAHVGQITSAIAKGAANAFVAEAFYWLGLYEFNPKGEAVINLLKTLCKEPGINCYDLMTAFTGKNCCLNSSTVELFLEHEPQSTATKNMIHIAQMIRGDTIAMFDYGNKEENNKHYGHPTPPVYNMSSIPNDVPLFISYGGQDELSDANDVERLLDSLKYHEGDKLTVQYRSDYAHADFVMGVNANQVVYEPMIAFFKIQSSV
ncbi:triacylglycerol lipase 2-like [Tasmannia lanceolata]|uniref:triacylglycerol lipase 2-like n=1 Tax=Tasmannia lanceolata TaxID=3420 RepID=UPI004062D6CC